MCTCKIQNELATKINFRGRCCRLCNIVHGFLMKHVTNVMPCNGASICVECMEHAV